MHQSLIQNFTGQITNIDSLASMFQPQAKHFFQTRKGNTINLPSSCFPLFPPHSLLSSYPLLVSHACATPSYIVVLMDEGQHTVVVQRAHTVEGSGVVVGVQQMLGVWTTLCSDTVASSIRCVAGTCGGCLRHGRRHG
jgi:hypothetical protein